MGRSLRMGRHPRSEEGSTYSPRSLTERWTVPPCPSPDPARPTTSPAVTSSPSATNIESRYERLTRMPSTATVTLRTPATVPANVTDPETGERTVPSGPTARSMPQCPAQRPTGAKPASTSPGAGGRRQTRERMAASTVPPGRDAVHATGRGETREGGRWMRRQGSLPYRASPASVIDGPDCRSPLR